MTRRGWAAWAGLVLTGWLAGPAVHGAPKDAAAERDRQWLRDPEAARGEAERRLSALQARIHEAGRPRQVGRVTLPTPAEKSLARAWRALEAGDLEGAFTFSRRVERLLPAPSGPEVQP